MDKIENMEARLIAHGTDPYGTTDPVHVAYHRRNRDRGRLGGQLRLRLRYRLLDRGLATRRAAYRDNSRSAQT